MPSEEYRRFVYRVWDRLQARTGRKPWYLDATHIASYCPACLDGILSIGFVEYPRPALVVDSGVQPGCCSLGCSERLVGETLA